MKYYIPIKTAIQNNIQIPSNEDNNAFVNLLRTFHIFQALRNPPFENGGNELEHSYQRVYISILAAGKIHPYNDDAYITFTLMLAFPHLNSTESELVLEFYGGLNTATITQELFIYNIVKNNIRIDYKYPIQLVDGNKVHAREINLELVKKIIKNHKKEILKQMKTINFLFDNKYITNVSSDHDICKKTIIDRILNIKFKTHDKTQSTPRTYSNIKK